jgi:hypothetical protein
MAPWLNNLLIKLGRVENKLLSAGWHMPWGSSLFVVAKKLG